MSDRLLTPAEVAGLFRVDRKTVGRWAKNGRLRAIRTPGGQNRFFASEINALLARESLANDSLAPERPVGGAT